MEAPATMLAPLAARVNPLELASAALGSSEESCGTMVRLTVSLAVAVSDPPPDTLNWFTNCAGALASTLPVRKIGG